MPVIHQYAPQILRGFGDQDGLLFLWGEGVRTGHYPQVGRAPRDMPRAAADPRRTPVPTWALDLGRAFAALAPATAGLADTGALAWLAHAPFSRGQLAVWLYYCDPACGLLGFGEYWRSLPVAARERLLGQYAADPLLAQREEVLGDALVATHLSSRLGGQVTPQRAGQVRHAAVEQMARFLGWVPDPLHPLAQARLGLEI